MTEIVKLCSSDGELFEVQYEGGILESSVTIKNLIEDNGTGETIPLPNVSGRILAKVIEYCNYHHSAGGRQSCAQDIERRDANFVDENTVDHQTLFDLILAANYLNIEGLLNLTCQKVAEMIKGKTPEEIRRQFHIKNDFTPEEEEEIRRENQWAFD